MAAEPSAPARVRVPVRRMPAAAGDTADWVVVEEPLEICLEWGGRDDRRLTPVSITMRTPGDDCALALGFLYTEGFITGMGDVRGKAAAAAERICIPLREDLEPDLARLGRHVVTTAACGVCGKPSLEALHSPPPVPLSPAAPAVPVAALARLPALLADRQPEFRATGGLHAAALFAADGSLLDVREDVGRHNALDKLIGAALLTGQFPLAGAGVLVSGRASFEIVQKARMAGCGLVAAVGAPSSLAVELAREEGMTLVGFLRDGQYNLYTGPGRIGPG